MSDLPKLPEFNHNWTDALRIAWLTAYGHCYASHARSPATVCVVPLRSLTETPKVIYEGDAEYYACGALKLLKRDPVSQLGETIRVRVVRVEEAAS